MNRALCAAAVLLRVRLYARARLRVRRNSFGFMLDGMGYAICFLFVGVERHFFCDDRDEFFMSKNYTYTRGLSHAGFIDLEEASRVSSVCK